jgi:predicted nucleic acid-binding protein
MKKRNNEKKETAKVNNDKNNARKAYFDTFVFMDLLSGNQDFMKKAENCIKNSSGVVSSVLLAELFYHLRTKKSRETAEQVIFYIQSLPNIEIIPVSEEIAILAGKLRARYRKRIAKQLTYFDCIHLATALVCECRKFVTGDSGFRDVKEIEMEIY